uniref:Retrotransposon gag protein n=1 Tax=Solanum tuberosum TaxID=4113 RepID=M1DFE4_SOLTU
MLIGDIDLARFMIHLQQVEEDKFKDREEFKDNRAKIVGDEFKQQKNDANQSSLPKKQKGPAPTSASAPAPGNKDGYNRSSYSFRARLTYPQCSMVPRGSMALACARCGRTHPGKCRDGKTGCFKCGQEGHFMKECPKNRMAPRGATFGIGGGANRLYVINSHQEQEDSPDVVTDCRTRVVKFHFPSDPVIEWSSSSAVPKGRFISMAPRGATFGTGGGANHLYVINSHQEQEDSPDVVTGMIRVFDFTVYALLDPRESLSFVTPCVANKFDVFPERPSEPFSVSMPVGEATLAKRVYRDCPVPSTTRRIMPPRRVVRVRPARRIIEEQELPSALEVQTQEEINYADFREAIRMLSQVATFHVGPRDNRHEVVDTLCIRELIRMNPPSFTGSSVTEDPENFIEELKRVFDVMHVAESERVELPAYQLKGVARIWFDQWKQNRAEDAPVTQVPWIIFQHTVDPPEHSRVSGEPPCFPEDSVIPFSSFALLVCCGVCPYIHLSVIEAS